MNLPQLPPGVRVMDEDHYALEQMFARTAEDRRSGPRRPSRRILAELAAHFAREEAEMARVGVPILPCHRGQHAALLAEGARLREPSAFAEPGCAAI